MSSVKDLFKKYSNTSLENSSMEDLTSSVESSKYVQEYIKKKDRFLPPVDFASASNFVKFGSAEKYYEDAINRTLHNYPYDGSNYEKLDWENSSSIIDLYIFENEYPRSTGYITFGGDPATGYVIDSAQPGNPTDKEYITLYGGPNTASLGMLNKPLSKTFSGSNVWDPETNRETNLKLDLSSGATVEFWIKFGDLDADKTTQTQIIFDLSNAQASGSDGESPLGRLFLYYYNNGVAADSGFKANLQSGSISTTTKIYTISDGLTLTSTGSWNHYAITAKNSGDDLVYEVYENGTIANTVVETNQAVNEITGALYASIGAATSEYYVSPGVTTGSIGWYKLSGSVDEFRYWKTARNAKEIGRHWFSQVPGGTNTDESNTQLGVYYKFNEGIVGTAATDSTVLDYSGRITNGNYAGYSTTYSRNTGSAIIESNASIIEHEDPIIYEEHQEVINLKTRLLGSGSVYDYENPSAIYNTIPGWIVEEDTGALKNLTQVISSYFDNAYLQIEALPSLRDNVRYTSASHKPVPFGKELLESVGLMAPEMFVDADIIEKLAGRSDEKLFADDLYNVKNRIYENIYNNLVHIYKSKGTEKAFRNLIRCYGVGEEVIDLKVYGNNTTFEFKDNRRPSTSRKKYADFNHPNRFSAVVYQQTASANSDSVSYLTGSPHLSGGWGMTFEAEALFPKAVSVDSSDYFAAPFKSSSIFGMHTVGQTSEASTGADVSWNSPDVANFQVLALKDYTMGDSSAAEVKFMLTGSAGGFFHPALTTSLYADVYNNERWNFAVKISPNSYPLSPEVSGTLPSSDNKPYTIEFYGVNINYGSIDNEFYLTSTIDGTSGKQFMTSSKRLFVGASKTNFLGSEVYRSDAKVTSARAWLSVLDNKTLLAHAQDPDNVGLIHPYENAYVFQDFTGSYIPRIETLLLDWDFKTVTGSDGGSGDPTRSDAGFNVPDVSSGSATSVVGGTSNYGWLGPLLGAQHTGRGESYLPNKADVVDTNFLYSSRQSLPEYLDSTDMVRILSQDEQYFTFDSRPVNYYYSIEKSMYESISREMIKYFATVRDFNNLIGEPVNKYRQEYKALGKMRQLFFDRVENDTIDFEKYLEYYKWIDSSLTLMLIQLIPASSRFSDGVRTMIESHVLERNKYWNKFPTLENKLTDPEDPARGINELLYNWKHGHAPVRDVAGVHYGPSADLEDENCLWWQEKANRDAAPLSRSSDDPVPVGNMDATSVNTDRVAIHDATVQVFNRKLNTPYRFKAVETKTIKAGQNAPSDIGNKAILQTFGNVKNESNTNLYRDFVYITGSNLEQDEVCGDLLQPKFTDEVGNADTKKRVSYYSHTSSDSIGSFLGVAKDQTPVTLYSSSVATGYVKEIQDVAGFSGLEATNLHNDSYGPDYETPLQGPFTEKYVGGHQYRHVDVNYKNDDSKDYLDSSYTRPEGYRIVLDNEDGGEAGTIIVSGPAVARTKKPVTMTAQFDNTPGAGTGAEGYVIDLGSDLDMENDFTISVWIKTSTDYSADTHGAVIFEVGDASTPFTEKFVLFIDENNLIGAGKSLATPSTSYATPINDGEWHHIVVTHTEAASGTVTLYVDGVQVGTPYAPVHGLLITNSDAVRIGLDKDALDYDSGFSGYMSSMSVFNVGLSAASVLNLYSGVSLAAPYDARIGPARDLSTWNTLAGTDELQAWWVFDSFFLVTDDSGRGNTLTAIDGGATRIVEAPGLALQLADAYKYSPFANRTREEYAKRPVNIKNIQQVASSGLTKIGNFEKNYQVVQTSGRKVNNIALNNLRQDLNSDVVLISSASAYVTGAIDYELLGLDSGKSVITERFSAPGSPEVLARGARDYTSEEYSPYNALPWRNLTVRQPMDSLLSEHSAKYGSRPNMISGTAQLDEPVLLLSASYHRVHRNTARRPEKNTRFENNYSIYFNDESFYTVPGTVSTLGLQDTSFSVFTWMKVPSTVPNNGAIFSIGAEDPQYTIVLEVDSPSPHRLRGTSWSSAGGEDTFFSPNYSITPNTWQHIGLTGRYNDDGGVEYATMYIDGESVATSVGASFSASIEATNIFTIGVEDYSVADKFRGWMSDMSIWSTELTGSDITQLYKFGANQSGPCDLNLHPMKENLVAWYRMGDETFGENLGYFEHASEFAEPVIMRDSSGNNLHARPYNLFSITADAGILVTDAPTASVIPYAGKFEATKVSKGATMDGAYRAASAIPSHLFSGSYASDLQLDRDPPGWSISMWIKPGAVASGQNAPIFVVNDDSAAATKAVLGVRRFDGVGAEINTLAFDADNISSGSPLLESTNTIVDGRWHHVVITNISTAISNMYIDGILADTSSGLTGIGSSEWVSFGAQHDADTGEWQPWRYKGMIDEVTIWNKPLSADEVNKLCRYLGSTDYTIGPINPYSIADATTSLTAWWRFGDTPGDTATTIVDGATGSFGLVNSGVPSVPTELTASTLISTTKGAPVYDNWYVQHPIPQSDLQYHWITSSYTSSDTFGYTTASDDISFVTSSDFGTFELSSRRWWGLPALFDGAQDDPDLFTDFVGLNANVYENLELDESNFKNTAALRVDGGTHFLQVNENDAATGATRFFSTDSDFSFSAWVKPELPVTENGESPVGTIFQVATLLGSNKISMFLSGNAGQGPSSATAVDAIDTTGYNAAASDASFTITIPEIAGGDITGGAGAITIFIDVSEHDPCDTPGAAADTIKIPGGSGLGTRSDAQVADYIIKAVNGQPADDGIYEICYANSGRGRTGVTGVTAAEGSSNTQITLTMDLKGPESNVAAALATVSGVDIIDVTDISDGQAGTGRVCVAGSPTTPSPNMGSTTTLLDGAWHHTAVTFNGTTNLVSLYVDGVLENSYTENIRILSHDTLTLCATGSDAGVTPGYYYKGSLDEVSGWNTALTAEEVLELYKNPLTGKTGPGNLFEHSKNSGGLNAWYRMGDAPAGMVLDRPALGFTTPRLQDSCNLNYAAPKTTVGAAYHDGIGPGVYPWINWDYTDANVRTTQYYNEVNSLGRLSLPLVDAFGGSGVRPPAEGQYRNVALGAGPSLGDPTTGVDNTWNANMLRAPMFNALMLHRNGPYQYPSWKQIRTADHPVARAMRKKNLLSLLPRGKETVTSFGSSFEHGSTRAGTTHRQNRYPARHSYISSMIQPVVSSKYMPLIHEFGAPESPDEVILTNTFSNNMATLNDAAVRFLGLSVGPADTEQVHTDIMDLARTSQLPPRQSLSKFTYRETVLPRQQNAFLKRTKQREAFDIVFWDPDKNKRIQNFVKNSQGETIDYQSKWVMDGRRDITSASSDVATSLNMAGELLNRYNLVWSAAPAITSGSSQFKMGVSYNRAGAYHWSHVDATGDETYTADIESGKMPFSYSSYDEYAVSLCKGGKDYTIVPEFRMSEHMNLYVLQNNGDFLTYNSRFLDLTGAILNNPADVANSAGDAFYSIYSLTDFMKFFDVVEQTHGGTYEPSRLTLKCKARKKFIPYDGFYPVQRTVQIASLFSQSYGPRMTYTGDDNLSYPNCDKRWRAALAPFYQPGIMYNTIKAGVAVDFPIWSGLDGAIKNHDGEYISQRATQRAPFEHLLMPEETLKYGLKDSEQFSSTDAPGLSSAINATASYNGTADARYKLAINNFCAETIDFFLKDSQLTTFASLPSDHPDFGRANQDFSCYLMDVKLSVNGEDAVAPPDILNYVNDSDVAGRHVGAAFGPSCEYPPGDARYPFMPPHAAYAAYARMKFVPPRPAGEDQTYSLDEILSNMTINYYHAAVSGYTAYSGSAVVDWMQLSASVNISSNPADLVQIPSKEVTFNAVGYGPETVTENQNGPRVLIQTRFETPILDFRSASLAARGIYPQVMSGETAGRYLGMWHNYGAPPTARDGIFLSLQDAKNSDVYDATGDNSGYLYNIGERAPGADTGSLADLMGFKKDSVKIGKPATNKTLREAVVAIPYQEMPNGDKNYYKINPLDVTSVQNMLREQQPPESNSELFEIYQQVEKMSRFVLPPRYDFLTYDAWRFGGPQAEEQRQRGAQPPISMFIFEFTHELTSRDITDIWQNLPPDFATKMETATATISSDLLNDEILQLNGPVDGAAQRRRDLSRIKFMVFKVKQKAKINYFKKTADAADDARFTYKFLFGSDGTNKNDSPPYSYNWPYDYFSMVELIKLDTSVEYKRKRPKPRRGLNNGNEGR